MSELAAGGLSLEDDGQPAPVVEAAVETPPAPETPPVTPPNPEDAEPEGTIVNPGGEKLVPLSALAAARQAAREAKAEAAALRPKAEKVEQIVAEWNAAQPILQKALQQQQQPPPVQKPAGPLTDQDAIEYAKDLDLYKADGTPDVDRAQRLASRQQRLAQNEAQQYVQPLMQQSAQQQSAYNFQQAANFKDQNGIQVDRSILQQIWSSVPQEMAAQPQIAAVLWRQAIAEMVIQGKLKPGSAPPPPPVVTESLGSGGAAPTPSLSSQSHAMRQAADIPEKTFTAMREKYQPGRTNSLE